MMRYHWIYHLHRHHTTTLLSPDFNPRVSLSTGSPGDPPMRIPRRQLLCCKWTMDSYLLCLLRLFVCEIKMTISLMWLIFKISGCVSHRYGNDLIIGAIWDIITDATPLIDHATENQRLQSPWRKPNVRMLLFILPISSSFYLHARILSTRVREIADVQITADYLLSGFLAVFYLLIIIYLPVCVKESVITNSDNLESRVNCHWCSCTEYPGT